MSSDMDSLFIILEIWVMKNNRKIGRLSWSGLLFSLVLTNISCVGNYLPDEKDAFDRDVNFTRTVFDPVMGHTVFYTNIFSSGNSTLPLTFEITDMQHSDGTPAPELLEYYPVRVWKKPYLGTEKSIEEINTKRGTEYRRLFDVRKHSGELVLWSEANSSILRCLPDSGYVFNMNISNSGGYKVMKRMRLMPRREVDFEPTIYDSETGLAIAEYVTPETSRMYYSSSSGSSSYYYVIDPQDIHVYFRENKDKQDASTSLSISFYDPSWNVIDPRRFNETNWNDLFQAGFLKGKVGTTEVVYDMAYPLPLFTDKTKYTDDKGEKARVKFALSYLSKYGTRRYSYFNFDFAIYKEAHWEMLIHFAKGMPQLGDIKD